MEVITTHLNADFDTFASMVAAKKLYPDAVMVFPGSQEKSLRNFFIQSTLYAFSFEKAKNIDINKITRLILVDIRNVSRIGKFGAVIGKKGLEVHIYDHHPPTDEDIKGDVEFTYPYGSTTTILTLILKDRNMQVTPEEATILMLGIYEDTGSLSFPSTKIEDFEAAKWLFKKGANLALLSEMLTRELTVDQVGILNELLSNAVKIKIKGLIVAVAKAETNRYVGDIAVLVHKMMDMETYSALFILVRMEDRVYLIARSRDSGINLTEIIKEFGGGGHPYAASATIKDLSLFEVEGKLKQLIKQKVRLTKTAKDIMTKSVKFVTVKDNIRTAGKILTRYNFNTIPVIEDEKVAGYITRQIVEKANFHGLSHINVKEYMISDIEVVSPDTSIEPVKEIIIEKRQKIVPVVEKGKLAGIITRNDLLRLFTETSEFYEESLHPKTERMKNLNKVLDERVPKDILKILKNLGKVAEGLNYPVYIVGGFVRDLFLRKENLDIDIVVEGDGIKFAETFAERYNFKCTTHSKFGTAILIFPDGFRIDIATARLEYYEFPGALPMVEVSSLKLDLYRRDFTINTLSVRIDGKHYGHLIDYFGGLKDMKERVIRVLHNLSFVEDPTRVFRAARFEQRFSFNISKHAQNLIKNAVGLGLLQKVSGERIKDEFVNILNENEPFKVIKRLDEFGVWTSLELGIEINSEKERLFKGFDEVLSWLKYTYIKLPPYQVWATYVFILVEDLNIEQLENFLYKLSFNAKMRKYILNGRIFGEKAFKELMKKRNRKPGEIYRIMHEVPFEMLFYLMVKTEREDIKRDISLYISKLKWVELEISGDDIIAKGYKPAPFFKEILAEILYEKLDGNVKERDEEIKMLDEKLKKIDAQAV